MCRMPVKTIAVISGVIQDLTTITGRLPDYGEWPVGHQGCGTVWMQSVSSSYRVSRLLIRSNCLGR